MAQVYRGLGRTEEASGLVERLHEMSSRRYVSPSARYLTHVGVQDAEQAYERLVVAIEERDPHAVMTMNNFTRLWPTHPGRAELLRMVNLDPAAIPNPPSFNSNIKSFGSS